MLSGLKAGERVVTSANFLVDSESKLKSAAGGMGMPGMSHGGSGAAGEKKAMPKEGQPTPQADHSQHQSELAKPERKILYWYDSMNPAYKSEKPGKAPDGMDLVPKYADEKKKQ